MRRALYLIALALIVAGLLGLVPLLRMRRVRAGSAPTVASGDPSGTAVSGSSAAQPGSAVAMPASPTVTASGAADSGGLRTASAVRVRVLGRIGGKLPRRLVKPRLVVEKTGRTLTVYSAGKAAKVYRIALGRFPDGDKQREGDGRTPLGHFYVCNKNAQSSYHKAFGLSYPNAEDAKRGLASGLISSRQAAVIRDAIEHHQQPPWGTELGGLIMIHGGGASRDWTTGCVAMNNADIDELFGVVPVGTEVVIEARPIRAASAQTVQVAR